MSTRIFLGIMVVVLAIAGYVVYTKIMDEEAVPLSGDRVSFSCNDTSYFVAEFSPEFDRVNIVVDGVVERSLARASNTDFYIFEDSSYTYTFAGEEVRVGNKVNGTETTCSQPFDPNNAPYNFGDLGEGGGDLPDIAPLIRDGIVGKWQSTEDEKFTREFQTGGMAVDGYEGMEDTTGTWEVFGADTGVETPFPQETGPDVVYLKMVMGEMAEEVLYFKVGKVTPTGLELIYMDRGGVLAFTRMAAE